MKLTKKDMQVIADRYKLGKVISYKYFSEGWVNFNFLIVTNKGKYVVQFFGAKFDEWKRNRMKLQFKVLNHLRKKKYPYEIPVPIKNRSGKYISRFKGAYCWAYNYIEGKFYRNYNDKQFGEVIKALAKYHECIEDLNVGKKDDITYGWFDDKFKKMRKVKPKNSLDKLMLKHLDFFVDLWEKHKNNNFNNEVLVTHSDFNNHNVLFNNSNVIGVIDFDNLSVSPRMKDLQQVMTACKFKGDKYTKEKEKIIFKLYEKYSKLSIEEKRLMIPLIIRNKCIVFWWYYSGMRKNRDKAERSIKEVYDYTRRLVKFIK